MAIFILSFLNDPGLDRQGLELALNGF